jgi:esterase
MNLNDFHYVVSKKPGKPWLIFLHGLLGSAANWRRITAAFEDDYQILAFDQRGHGRSFKPSSGYAPADFAHDLKFIMDELEISAAALIGHSMGGRNALCFASLYPGSVSKLVIEDIGPEPSIINGRDLIVSLQKVPVPFLNKKTAKEYLLNEFKDPKMGNFLYTNIVTDDSGQWVWGFDLKNITEIIERGRGTSQWAEFESLKIPILIIRGEKSAELSREEFNVMLARNKNAIGVEIERTGHWVHFEEAQKFIEEVRKFLD